MLSKPHVRTQQQNIYTAEGEIKFRLFWNRYSDRVATFSSIENPYQWENGFCTYLGFATKAVMMAWQQHLLRIGIATTAEYRKVNRLKVDKPKNVAIRWELKVRGLTYFSYFSDILSQAIAILGHLDRLRHCLPETADIAQYWLGPSTTPPAHPISRFIPVCWS